MSPLKFRFIRQYGWLIVISTLLMGGLITLSQILQNSSDFAQGYASLLIVTFGGLLLLLLFFIRTFYRLFRQYRQQQPGSQITARLTLTLTLIIGLPLITIYYFSMNFIQQGIDQWFDVKTEQALQSALELADINLDDRTLQKLRQTQAAVQSQQKYLFQDPVFTLNQLRKQLNANELALFNSSGQLIAFSAQVSQVQLPKIEAVHLQQIKQNQNFATLVNPPHSQQGHILVLIPLQNLIQNQTLMLQATFKLNEQITQLAENVRLSSGQYQELSYLKDPLKNSLNVILSLAFLLALVTAILFTLQAIRNMMRPIQILAQGTQAITQGDYSHQMPIERKDEFGQLMHSFNIMTQQIAKARNEIKFSHQQTEIQKLYLQAIIKNLNSGVLTLDPNLSLRTVNHACNAILSCDFTDQQGKRLPDILLHKTTIHLQELFDQVLSKFKEQSHWQQQFNFESPEGQKILLLHGSPLPSMDQKTGGYVLILEDITQLVKAQLHAAWNDVAQRLAHEIKNPLTPIQLSAERLQFKLNGKLEQPDQQLLTRLTQTIIDQVRAMEQLVTAFNEYAAMPKTELLDVSLHQLIQNVAHMYQSPDFNWQIRLKLDAEQDVVQADKTQLLQLLHNLIKNALEACELAQITPQIQITTQQQQTHLQLQVCDNGPGINHTDPSWIFEPYATNKPKGTGLGLAIVKKIVDEHQGKITVFNQAPPLTGTCFSIQLPL